MPWAPSEHMRGGELLAQGIDTAASTINTDLQKALAKYEEDKKQRNFNTGLLDTLKGSPATAKYIPVDALEKWDSMNSDKQAGILAGATRRMSADQAAQKQADAHMLALAHADYYSRARQAGAGGGDPLQLSDEEIQRATSVGKTPLRTSRGSFQYAEDPNNPVNLGTAEPVPVHDPRDKNKILGLQQSNGVIKYFPKPSDMQTLIDTGLIHPDAKAAPAASATPAAVPNPPKPGEVRAGYKFKGGDPADPNSWEQVK